MLNFYGPPLVSKHTDKEWPPSRDAARVWFKIRNMFKEMDCERDIIESNFTKFYGAEYYED